MDRDAVGWLLNVIWSSGEVTISAIKEGKSTPQLASLTGQLEAINHWNFNTTHYTAGRSLVACKRRELRSTNHFAFCRAFKEKRIFD